MPVVIARVDERLVHGQVALSWLKSYPIDVVITVDDESANNALKTMLLKMAVSGTIISEVSTVSNAKEIIEKYNDKNIFLCAKSPEVYKELLIQGVKIPDINIGGMYSKVDRKQYYTTIFLTDEEKETIISLKEFPVKVEHRMLPKDKEIKIIEELENK